MANVVLFIYILCGIIKQLVCFSNFINLELYYDRSKYLGIHYCFV